MNVDIEKKELVDFLLSLENYTRAYFISYLKKIKDRKKVLPFFLPLLCIVIYNLKTKQGYWLSERHLINILFLI